MNISKISLFSLAAAGLLTGMVSLVLPSMASAAAGPYTVTINKFIDGTMATATSAAPVFPMVESWNDAANSFSGSNVSYSLSSSGINTSTPYTVITSPGFNVGTTYATNEVTSSLVVGVDCTTGTPYALVGYSTGTSLPAAASSSISTSTPNFASLTSSEFVIVWNKNCLTAPTLLSPVNGAITATSSLTLVQWNPVTDSAGGITYVYQASNATTTNLDGSFVAPVVTSGVLATTTQSTPAMPAGVYFWHVQAKDADGNLSPWSATWTFTVSNSVTPPSVGNGVLNGEVYNDLNRSGVKDVGESGLAGFTINLYGSANFNHQLYNNQLATTTTDANGSYSFGNLADGTYSIEQVKMSGWDQLTSDYSSVIILGGTGKAGLDFGDASSSVKTNGGNGNGNGDHGRTDTGNGNSTSTDDGTGHGNGNNGGGNSVGHSHGNGYGGNKGHNGHS